MITIKNRASIAKMHEAGQRLAHIFQELPSRLMPGISTLDIDSWISLEIKKNHLVSKMLGYSGYGHVSCISINDEVVHGVPHKVKCLSDGDLVKIDVCVAYKGYCADMARSFFVGQTSDHTAKRLVEITALSLDKGIEQARAGNRLGDVSAAIGHTIESAGFGIVRDFAGHGIGKRMHEDPEVLNYGIPGKGPLLQVGMAFAIEPMVTVGHYDVYITEDNWTVKTTDKSLAAHVEDTVVITQDGPLVITRIDNK